MQIQETTRMLVKTNSDSANRLTPGSSNREREDDEASIANSYHDSIETQPRERNYNCNCTISFNDNRSDDRLLDCTRPPPHNVHEQEFDHDMDLPDDSISYDCFVRDARPPSQDIPDHVVDRSMDQLDDSSSYDSLLDGARPHQLDDSLLGRPPPQTFPIMLLIVLWTNRMIAAAMIAYSTVKGLTNRMIAYSEGLLLKTFPIMLLIVLWTNRMIAAAMIAYSTVQGLPFAIMLLIIVWTNRMIAYSEDLLLKTFAIIKWTNRMIATTMVVLSAL